MEQHKISEVLKKHKKVSFAFFNLIANVFSVVFVMLVWVQIVVAGKNAERVVMVFWNHFGEYSLEVVLFGFIGLLVIINAFFSFRRIREMKAERR